MKGVLIPLLVACVTCTGRAAAQATWPNAPDAAAAAADPDADALEIELIEPADPGQFPLTGDWGGWRSAWEEQGVVVEGSWTLDSSNVVSGGAQRGNTTQSLFDVGVSLDLDPLLGWKGGTFFAEFWTKWGRSVTDDVGDYEGTSNIDAPSQSQNAQLWLQQWLVPDRLRFKLGKQELFDEFAVVNGAVDFLNNGVTYSPSIFVAPSYPNTAWSAGLYAAPVEHTWLSLALFDGAGHTGVNTGSHGPGTFYGSPSDDFVIAEAGGDWPGVDQLLAGRLGVGYWHHDGDFDRFDGGTQSGTSGSYVVFDQALWREDPEAGDDPQGLDAFALFGAADQDVSDVARHASAGVTWTGPMAERDDDVFGLAATAVRFTDESGAGYTRDFEVAVELFYKWQSTAWMSIKPDLQYVFNPGGDAALDDAIVATLRFEFSL